jgi:hypothetical protein
MIKKESLLGLCLLFLSLSCGRNDKDLEKFDTYQEKRCDKNCAGEEGTYIAAKNRNDYLLTISNGLFYDKNNDLVDSSGVYVMSSIGDFYYQPLASAKDRSFFHSRFLAGRPVAGAGWLKFKQGKLVLIDNAGGHYKPNTKYLWQTLRELSLKGVDLSYTAIRTH